MDALTGDGAGGISIIGVIVIVVVFLFTKMRGGKGGGISLPGRGAQRPSSPQTPTAPRERPGTGNAPKAPSGGSGAGDLVRDLEKSGEKKKEF